MDRGRPTRLSSKSGCRGERTVKAWPHRLLGAGVPAPLHRCPSSSWAGELGGRAGRKNSLAGGAEGLAG